MLSALDKKEENLVICGKHRTFVSFLQNVRHSCRTTAFGWNAEHTHTKHHKGFLKQIQQPIIPTDSGNNEDTQIPQCQTTDTDDIRRHRLHHISSLLQRLPLRSGEPLAMAQLQTFPHRTLATGRRTDDVGRMLPDPIFPLPLPRSPDARGDMGNHWHTHRQGLPIEEKQLRTRLVARHCTALFGN